MRVLVTGANGLLASNTIKHLMEADYEVRGLIRNKSKFHLKHSGVELVQGDLLNKTEVEKAVENCDCIVHIAAVTDPALLKYEDYERVNVQGTDILLNAAEKAGVRKFIYISSATTIGYGSKDRPGNEKMPVKEPFSASHYTRSKIEAEKKVLSFSEKTEVLVLNPSFILGPYDAKPSSGKIILMGHDKNLIFCPPGGKNFVNAKDVARAIGAAIEQGKNGESYLVTGENLSYKEFFSRLGQRGDKKPRILVIPVFLLLIAGKAGDLLRFFGIQTAISSVNMRILCISNFYSNKKAREELNLDFSSIDFGIKEAVKWFRKKDML